MSNDKLFPVTEIFGPVIQGEGAMAGWPTYFVRFAGCDYRCSWCDTPYSVLPDLIKQDSKRMTYEQIIARLEELCDKSLGPYMVTFSGGNPAIHDLSDLVKDLKILGWEIAVETQGTMLPEWLQRVDQLTISPKPPSSGMIFGEIQQGKLLDFLRAHDNYDRCIKIVVFDEEDLKWAEQLIQSIHGAGVAVGSYYIQPGTNTKFVRPEHVRRDILDRTEEIIDLYFKTSLPRLGVRVLPQIHTLIYGQVRGV